MNKVFYEKHSMINSKKPYTCHHDSMGCPPHWHENVEILLFHVAGKVYIDQELYEVEPGDIVVVSSDLVHSVPINPEIFYDCLIVDREYCADNHIDTAGLNFQVVIRDEKAAELYRRIIKESESETEFAEAALRAEILNFMVYLGRNYLNSSRPNASNNQLIKQAIKYINTRFTGRISVDDIAGHISISKYHFCREFKKETGYTVVGYINLMRCLRAEKLLSSGKYTVSEAARECGFENLSYFSKTFKSVTGTLPVQHKKDIPATPGQD